MTIVTLRWVAALDADATTDYRIDSDEAVSGTFVTASTENATDRGGGVYTPASTTLNGALTSSATTVILTSGADFAEGDYVVVDREMILLGAKSTHTFTGCTRGIGGTVPVAHDSLDTVYKAHETKTYSTVDFGSRHCIRYRVFRVQGANVSLANEIVVVNPPDPPSDSHVTLYGVLETIGGAPSAAVPITLAMAGSNNYGLDTGELIITATSETDTSDADGFFSVFVRRFSTRSGSGAITLTIGSLTWNVLTLPDVPHINFLET